MGFISSSSTITVQAKLTDAGKKKLYDSIEQGGFGFISKFALGDSDSDYAAIDAGVPALESGYVPEVSGFKPSLRSYVMYKGVRNPEVAMILINNEYGTNNGVSRDISIATNLPVSFEMNIKTEWPKDTIYQENYIVEIENTGNLTPETLARFFSIANIGQKWLFGFLGGLSPQDMVTLIGSTFTTANGTIIPIKITGRSSGAIGMYNIRITR